MSNLQEMMRARMEVEKQIPKLCWLSLSKSIILLRQVRITKEQEQNDYYVFLIHTPTLFKTRGRYVLIGVNDKKKLSLLREMKGYEFANFSLTELNQVKSTIEAMPFLALSKDNPQFLDLYDFDNSSELIVKDILDVLDYILINKGHIHFDPGVGESFIEENEEFKLSTNKNDYITRVHDFVTSREKPSLSYGYLLYGEKEGEEGRNYETRKYFKYPIINDEGKVDKDILKFSVPNTTYAKEHLNMYLGHLIIKDTIEETKERVEFLINTGNLLPIETLHELPITKQLIQEREISRVMVRSLREFKAKVSSLSSRVGMSLVAKYDNRFVYDQLGEKKEGEMKVISRVKYTTQETKEGDLPMKDLYKNVGIPLNYIEILIDRFLKNEITQEVVERHIERASEVFESKVLGEAFRSLFSCIPKHENLKGMFEESDYLAKSVDLLGNSQKLRLHVFGLSDSIEGQAFLYRMVSGEVKITLNKDYGMVRMEYENEGKDSGTIEMTVDAKL